MATEAVFPDEHLALLKRHLAAENSHDMAGTLATLTPDCVFEDRAVGERWIGHEGAAQYYERWWAAFSTVVASEVRHFPRADLAIVETRWSGRHVGPMWGIPATGKDIGITVLITVSIRDGLMSGERFLWDRVALLKQLGISQVPAEWMR